MRSVGLIAGARLAALFVREGAEKKEGKPVPLRRFFFGARTGPGSAGQAAQGGEEARAQPLAQQRPLHRRQPEHAAQCASEAQSQRGASPLRVGASYPKPEVTALPQGRVESNGR